ncbi:recombinase family protein [Natronococcus sp. JC468]|uniref:recombinase family protein n=1 Tax=Natronococcus sp. JC468 TaxID=1961921 RepID=UPI00143C5D7D|nr:recombinase family protein [Natronococcus sp. JC468]NKE37520.1 recombinase family protein [Natronococcus sp. JC468]
MDHATYIRASTDEQTDQHQRESIDEWLRENGVGLQDADHYADLGESGVSDDREQFGELLEAIEDGESYRSAAEGLPLSRQSLSKIYRDDERRRWYLEATAENDAVHAALESVQTAPVDRNPAPRD